MSHAVWFRTPLRCLQCGAMTGARETRLHSAGLNPDPIDDFVESGAVLALEAGDFETGYRVLRAPGADETTLLALETWACRHCGSQEWAVLTFERLDPQHVRWQGAVAVALTPELVRSVHYVSHDIGDRMTTGNTAAG